MEPDRRQRVQAVALEALGRSAEERAAFLDAACAGDAALRDEVDSLLAGQAQAALFDSPPWAAPAAPLPPGTRLGPYEIDALIGGGGMGDVYKAKDTRLGRTVAIKVLPSALAADAERRRRFEREARAVSALNHPHICALHDVGAAVPSSLESRVPNPESRIPIADPVHYLVLEHLAGGTLAERLRKGRLPIAEALRVAIDIADALSAAHRAGIVHRDLKPGNVMLTKSGAKLLDFGLAKLVGHGAGPAAGHLASAATRSGPLTEEGMIVGTLQYMAPEQVEGKPADARSDLWALGAILYEMLTGARTFEGPSAASLIGNIMNAEPAPLLTLQPLTPLALDRLVRQCLAKSPDDRPDTAHDVANELRSMREPTGVGRPARVHPWSRQLLLTAVVVAAGLVLFLSGMGAMWLSRPPAPFTAVARLALLLQPAEELCAVARVAPNHDTCGGGRTALTWTPDGQALVFVARQAGVQRLYVRRLDADEARPLAGTEGAQAPAVSADGQWVAFWANGAIRKVPLRGGVVMDLLTGLPRPPSGLVWDAGGGLFFGSLSDWRIWQIPVAGAPAAVTLPEAGEIRASLPWPLPGGRAIVYTARGRWFSWGDEEVIAWTLGSSTRKVLLKNATDARYVSTGHLVFLRQGKLFAVPFDPDRLEVVGREVPILDKVAQALTATSAWNITGAGQWAVAQTGTLAWVPSPVVPFPGLVPVTVDRGGRVTDLSLPARSYSPLLRVSHGGRRLAVLVRSLSEVGVWAYDFGRGSLEPLNRDGESDYLAWSPDGRRLAFSWLAAGSVSLATQLADGSAPTPVLVQKDFYPSSFTPDWRQVVAATPGRDILVGTLESNKASVQPLIATPKSEEMWPELSPDGRWLAYASNKSGRYEIYIRPYPGTGPDQQISVEGGEDPAWHPSGRELFFLTPVDGTGRRMMAVKFLPGSPLRRPRPLFGFDVRELFFHCVPVRCYDVAPDGQRFYTVQWPTLPPPPPITHINLVPNWFEELKAKVPVK